MKKLTIPCDFQGKKSSVDFYVGTPKKGCHPVQKQSHWLSTERGGIIIPSINESLEKISALALQNKVNFEELCAYAIKTAGEEQPSKDPDELLK